MQAEKFRTLALYYLIFRAECTLLISLFPKEFYPVGGVALSRRFGFVQSSLEQQGYDRVVSFPLHVILCSGVFDSEKAVYHDTRPKVLRSHQPPWKLCQLVGVKLIYYLWWQKQGLVMFLLYPSDDFDLWLPNRTLKTTQSGRVYKRRVHQ